MSESSEQIKELALFLLLLLIVIFMPLWLCSQVSSQESSTPMRHRRKKTASARHLFLCGLDQKPEAPAPARPNEVGGCCAVLSLLLVYFCFISIILSLGYLSYKKLPRPTAMFISTANLRWL